MQKGLAVSINGPFKIDSDGGKNESIHAVGTVELQKDLVYADIANLYIVPIDTDGKAIATKRGGLWYQEDGKTSLESMKKGMKCMIKAYVSVGSTSANSRNTSEMKRWAKLANSDEFKKLKEQLEADKKAEEIEAAKKVVGEK